MNHSFYPTILYLEDGVTFQGWSLTNFNTCIGEVVFNTGMTGYQEIMTDPSYSGQIITFSYPEIGNTGMNDEDNESNTVHVSGIILKNICLYSYNWRSEISFVDYLIKYEIPHIFGIDTRSLTKHLRNQGAMNGCISNMVLEKNKLKKFIQKSPAMEGLDLVKSVTTKEPYRWKINDIYISKYNYTINKTNQNISKSQAFNIIVLDFGIKYNILSRLSIRGCNIHILPATSTLKLVLSYNPDGVLLSNGPGDPSVVQYAITTVRSLICMTNIPIFGICMGHQILSLALGGTTFKLKFGHRGLNHPAGSQQKVEITSQNHGFSVSLSNELTKVTHLNLNDVTIAGILHLNKPLFSVQYHPEASPGPHDSDYLFNSFIHLIDIIKSLS